jgi:hypothetical protein
MPQAVAFELVLPVPLGRELRASCKRFVVARTSRSLSFAVNRRRCSAVAVRKSAYAWRPVVTLGQAAARMLPVISLASCSGPPMRRREQRCAAARGEANISLPLLSFGQYPCAMNRAKALHNKSANTDPQHYKAASPQLLRAGCLQRYAARRRMCVGASKSVAK